MSVKGTILVVDDTLESLKLLTDMLTEQGYQVRPADCGELALASVEKGLLPDLILLDIRMPGLDGFEICRRLKAREDTRSIPVMFITVAAELEDRVAGLRLGAADYVSKPFQPEELLARVETHLEIGRLRARAEQRADDLDKANRQLQAEIAERKRVEEERGNLIRDLQTALAEIKTLRGILPICSSCKKIRDDKGNWIQIEVYVRDRSEADFSHSICPECSRKLYPEFQ